MENKLNKQKTHLNKQKLGIGLLVIVLIAAVFAITYYITTHRSNSQYISVLNDIKVKLDKQNENVAKTIGGIADLDVENAQEINKVINTLDSAQANIQIILNDLSNVVPPEKYKEQYDIYVNGITLNKKVFVQASIILKNTKSNQLQNALDDLSKYVTQTSSTYASAKLKDVQVTLPDAILTMPDKLSQFAFKAYSDYQTKDTLLRQYSAYFSAMDDVVNSFGTAKVNLSSNIEMIKSNQLTFNDVYSLIENKLSQLNDIKDSYGKLSVPLKIAANHNNFNKILNEYTFYCEDFKAAVLEFEESTNDPNKLSDSESQFESLKNEYNKIDDAYNNFLDKYNSDKIVYTDINNM